MAREGTNGDDDPYETEPVKTRAERSAEPRIIVMSERTREWIDELKGITVLELVHRIKALEEAFGVSAHPAAATTPASGNGAAAHLQDNEEQSTFDVVITSAGDKKIQVIKVVRAATSLGLKEAKTLVEDAPTPVLQGLGRGEADKLKSELEAAGATVDLK